MTRTTWQMFDRLGRLQQLGPLRVAVYYEAATVLNVTLVQSLGTIIESYCLLILIATNH